MENRDKHMRRRNLFFTSHLPIFMLMIWRWRKIRKYHIIHGTVLFFCSGAVIAKKLSTPLSSVPDIWRHLQVAASRDDSWHRQKQNTAASTPPKCFPLKRSNQPPPWRSTTSWTAWPSPTHPSTWPTRQDRTHLVIIGFGFECFFDCDKGVKGLSLKMKTTRFPINTFRCLVQIR